MSSPQQLRLEQLFNRCDTNGSGYIERGDFHELCASFAISPGDADAIFDDLDHDGDGRISFQDFSYGFKDFLTPGARRGSIQLGMANVSPSKTGASAVPTLVRVEDFDYETRKKQQKMEKKHADAQEAWRHFADHLGKEDVKRFLSVSSDKIFTLYEELQTSDAPPHLVNQYEEVISALVADVKKMETETKKMEEKMAKERESHTTHLKNIEAELDAQVAKVETAAREKAKRDHEEEKRQLQDKMEEEIRQMQTQLKIFQKIDTYLNKEKEESTSQEALKKLEQAISENRSLKSSLNETQTNIALLRGELNQVRSKYDAKCYELSEERQNNSEFVYEFDNLSRQLELLREANQRLQDTNDGLRTVVDVGALNSPRAGSRTGSGADVAGGASLGGLLSPDILRSASDVELAERLYKHPLGGNRRNRRRRLHTGTRSPALSDNGGGGGSGYDDSDSVRSKGSVDRPRLTDTQFGIKRLMEDLDKDSGHSTLPNEDLRLTPEDDDDDDLDYDAREAIDRLDGVVGEASADLSPGETRRPQVKPRTKYDDDEDDEEQERAEGLADLPRREMRRMEVDYDRRGSSGSVKSAVHRRTPTPTPRRNSDAPRPRSRDETAPGGVRRKSSSLRDLEPTGPPDRTYKVVFAGDAAVGKTSFINRLTKGVFLSNLSSTLGVDFQVKTIRVDDRNIAIQLWDTAGQERFRSVTRSYFRRADGVMLLYDVTSDRSFLSVRQWIDAVDDVSEKRIPIMLCANKVDLRAEASAQGRRCISTDEGDKVARDHSAIFIETSAKEGSNVIDALVQLCRDMCSSEDVEVQTSALKIRDEPKKKNCCK